MVSDVIKLLNYLKIAIQSWFFVIGCSRLQFYNALLEAPRNTSTLGYLVQTDPGSFCSFGDAVGSSISDDVLKLGIGYVLIIIYVSISLGKFNCMEQRVRMFSMINHPDSQ